MGHEEFAEENGSLNAVGSRQKPVGRKLLENYLQLTNY